MVVGHALVGERRYFNGDPGALGVGDLVSSETHIFCRHCYQCQIGNRHIDWNVPTEGGALWTDNMLIPKGGNVYTASVYMNYVYDPKVQALIEAGDPKRNITGVDYIPPVIGAKEEALKLDPTAANNQLIFPSAKTLSQVHSSTTLR